jgi:hypothetical protein
MVEVPAASSTSSLTSADVSTLQRADRFARCMPVGELAVVVPRPTLCGSRISVTAAMGRA